MEILENEKKLDIIYFVKKGDCLSEIAAKFCVSLSIIRKCNNLLSDQEVEEGDILWIKQANKFCHIVKPLENLSKIARMYGVTIEHIKEVNEVDDIFIGQKLFI